MKKLLLVLLLLIPFQINAVSKQATVINPDTLDRKVVNVGDPTAFDDGYVLEVSNGYEFISSDKLGYSVASSYSTTLSSSMTSTQSTVSVSSITTKIGDELSMAVLGTKAFFTLEPGGSKEEIVMCTGLSGTSWTGCTRGLSSIGTSTVTVVARRKTHSAGSILIMSNVHYVYDEMIDKDTDETIAGIKTFSSSPIVPSPTTDNQVANKIYIDNVAIQGGATSTESVVGLSQLATQLEMAGNDFDANNPQVISTKYSTSSPDVAGSYAIISEADGNLDQDWLDLSEDFSFSGDVTLASTTITGTLKLNATDVIYPTASSSVASRGYVDTKAVKNEKIYSTTTDITLGDTILEETFFTFTLPANSLGTDGILDISLFGNFKANAGYYNTYTVIIDSTEIMSIFASTNYSTEYGRIDIQVFGDGTTNSQEVSMQLTNSLHYPSLDIPGEVASGNASKDTTSDLVITVTCESSNAYIFDSTFSRGYANLIR